jgi:hypothetical protein
VAPKPAVPMSLGSRPEGVDGRIAARHLFLQAPFSEALATDLLA